MATISKPDQNLQLNLPDEGTIFRVTGDNGDAVYQIKNGQISTIAAPSFVAATAFKDKATGQTYKAGDILQNNPHDVTWLDPSYRGTAVSRISAADAYKKQTGTDFQTLPQFNMADIQQGISLLQQNNQPYGNYTVGVDPTIQGYKNPNANSSETGGYQGQPAAQATPTVAAPSNTTSTTQQPNSNLHPPTGNLQPGTTGDAVKQLQDFLVSKGYLTQAQINTGYGTYGPQTTAAVAKMQQDLGVNNSSGVGYYGPLTIAAVTGQSTNTTGNSTSSTGNSNTNTSATSSENSTGNSTTGTGLTFNTSYGVTQDQWNQMNDPQRAIVAAAYTAKQSAYNTDGQQLTFADALTQAAKDPNIVAQFADAAKLDTQSFAQNLQQLQQTQTVDAQKTQMQFENDRRALAEQEAAKGAAISGFRNKAQEQLGQSESGIVQSSRAALQKNLNDATQAFEAKYGTGATTPANIQFNDPFVKSNYSLSGQYVPSANSSTSLSGNLAGGITGTEPIAKNNAINAKAESLYNIANVTPTVA